MVEIKLLGALSDQSIQEITELASMLHEEKLTLEKVKDTVRAYLGDSDRALLAAIDDNQIVGMALMNTVRKFNGIQMRLDEVVVNPNQRGKGIGTQLVEAVESWATEHGCIEIEFTSSPNKEAANHLYQKCGYDLRETNVYRKRLT